MPPFTDRQLVRVTGAQYFNVPRHPGALRATIYRDAQRGISNGKEIAALRVATVYRNSIVCAAATRQRRQLPKISG